MIINGTRRLVDAAKTAGVQHYLLTSTMGVYQNRSIFRPLGILFYPKWQAEEYLVKSGLTYTIIRPGGLVDEDEKLKLATGSKRKPVLAATVLNGNGGFEQIGRVHRQDVAEALVKCLLTPATHNRLYDILDASTLKTDNAGKILPNF